jgi:hypothetical protein
MADSAWANRATVVPDPVEPVWQDVHEEAADKLARLERYGLVAAGRVAGQIGRHLLGAGERPLAVDGPLGPMQWCEIGLERGLVGEVGMIAEELQATGVVRGEEHLQLQAAE